MKKRTHVRSYNRKRHGKADHGGMVSAHERGVDSNVKKVSSVAELGARDRWMAEARAEWDRIFTDREIYGHWSDGTPLTYKKVKYRVGRMSYGTYFLEPLEHRRRGETEPFHRDTLWLEKKVVVDEYGNKKVIYQVDIHLLR